MNTLSILFFLTAILYSSVGFGGGSTYLALLLIWGVPYTIFPIIALACNIIVVSGNCFNYIRAGNLNLKLLIPYLIGSIPLSFIGGSLNIEKQIFEILLFFVLLIAGCLLLINFNSYDDKEKSYKNIPQYIYMGALDDNDAVQFDDAYNVHERAIINSTLGREVQDRYRKC